MTTHSAFTLERDEELRELHSRVRIWSHNRTGAQVVSVINDDENKVFGITFKTPPTDSTGVAHILEHSVLCGSRRYPVKEPFVELLKGSLQTFLNAFTYPDKTCYPVASVNIQDFHNLVEVYLDAVLHPRITREIFSQEGWHVVPPEENDGKPGFKGVVFNEMKGAYSSPDSLLGEYTQHSLFPDTLYCLDSGGHPLVIPDLTYEAFKGFHESYYHPSNARIWFWGDDPEDERLDLLDSHLREFTAQPVTAEVPLQPAFSQPVGLTERYPAGEGEGDRAMVVVNWLLDPNVDDQGRTFVEERFLQDMLEYILIGQPGSPLRKALIDSGIGTDMAGFGLELDLRQMCFSVGLKGVALDRMEEVEPLILGTLESLASEGIDPGNMEAAMNTAEFSLRENNTGSFPRGLEVMLRSLNSWLHGGDPLAFLRFEEPLARIKERIASGENVFEDLIRASLLDNMHRTTLFLTPDSGLGKENEAAEATRLARVWDELDETGRDNARRMAQAVRQWQETPDNPEDLDKLPRLSVDDLAPENTLIPVDDRQHDDVELLVHEMGVPGIVYLDLALNLEGLDPSLVPYLPLYRRALMETGAGGMDFVEMGLRIAAKTGGLGAEAFVSNRFDTTDPVFRLVMRGKATTDKVPDLYAIASDILSSANITNMERLRQIVMQMKTRHEHRLAPAGHSVANTRLGARFTKAGALNETMQGLSQLFFLRELADKFEERSEELARALTAINAHAIDSNGLMVNLTSDGEGLAAAEKALPLLLDGLPRKQGAYKPQQVALPDLPRKEGVLIPAGVNYVGAACNVYDAGYEPSGAAEVIGKYLRTGWLWEMVRVRGGAYGGFSMFDRVSGYMAFLSYRDPNVTRTLEIFEQTGPHLKDLSMEMDEVGKNIIGAIGGMDSHLLPDAKGFVSLARRLNGDSDERRARLREDILSTGPQDFRRYGEALCEAMKTPAITVVGGSDMVREAAGDDWELLDIL